MAQNPVLRVALSGVLAWSCTAVPSPESALPQAPWLADDFRAEVLKAQMSEFQNRFVSAITLAAERIAAGTGDAEVRRQAVLWKAGSVALANEATFRSDPLTALFDTWCLCAQMEEYLSSGPGRGLFGAQQAIAIEALSGLEAEIRAIAKPIVRDPSMLEDLVAEAVERHPIEGTLLTRTSAVLEHADLATAARDLSDVALNLSQKMTDLHRHLTAWMAWLPEQLRWQAELLLADDLTVGARGLERMGAVLEELPELVREERRLVLEAVERHLADVLAALTAERMAVAAQIVDERGELVAAIDVQRLDTLERLTAERIALVESMRGEREQVVGAANEAVSNALARTEQLVDRTVRWLALALAGLAAAAFVALRWRRPLFGFDRRGDRAA